MNDTIWGRMELGEDGTSDRESVVEMEWFRRRVSGRATLPRVNGQVTRAEQEVSMHLPHAPTLPTSQPQIRSNASTFFHPTFGFSSDLSSLCSYTRLFTEMDHVPLPSATTNTT